MPCRAALDDDAFGHPSNAGVLGILSYAEFETSTISLPAAITSLASAASEFLPETLPDFSGLRMSSMRRRGAPVANVVDPYALPPLYNLVGRLHGHPAAHACILACSPACTCTRCMQPAPALPGLRGICMRASVCARAAQPLPRGTERGAVCAVHE